MKKGTILRDKFSGRFFTATGEISTMTNGKRTWECIEFDNGSRVSVEEVERLFEVVEEAKESKEAEQEIAKFKVDTLRNPNGRGIKIYNFNKETVDVGYITVNDKIFRKIVKKYTFKDGSWCFYIKKGGRNICVYDWQITMTDEWAAIEFSRFKKYGAR